MKRWLLLPVGGFILLLWLLAGSDRGFPEQRALGPTESDDGHHIDGLDDWSTGQRAELGHFVAEAGVDELQPSALEVPKPLEDPEPNRARFKGRVVDPAGFPKADMSVEARVWPGKSFISRTALDGSFQLDVDWPGDHRDTWFEFFAAEFPYERCEQRGELVPGEELALGEIRLNPGGAVEGRVLLGGRPVEDAWVTVVKTSSAPGLPVTVASGLPEGADQVAFSGVDRGGSFHVVGLAPGQYEAWAAATESWFASTPAFDVAAGRTTFVQDIQLTPLPPDSRIAGVVSTSDGRAVPGVWVHAWTIQMHEATTDEDGRYVLFLRSFDSEEVEDGLGVWARPADDSGLASTEILAHLGQTDAHIALRALRSVRLIARDPEGERVHDFEAWGSYEDQHSIVSCFPSDGVLSLPEGCPAEVTVEAHGFERLEVPISADREGDIIFELTRSSKPMAITGVVRDAGEPVAGAHVHLSMPYAGDIKALPDGGPSGLRYSSGDCVTTDDQGRFEIRSRFAYDYIVEAFSTKLGLGSSELVRLGADVVIDLHAYGRLSGRLLLPEDADATGARLRAHRQWLGSLECNEGRESWSTVGEDGSFSFDRLEEGPWLISVDLPPGLADRFGPGRDMEWKEEPFLAFVAIGRGTIADLSLRAPAGSCELNGLLQIGDRVRQGSARLIFEGHPSLVVATSSVDESGRFHLETRTPGRYRIVVDAGPEGEDHTCVTDVVDLSPGKNAWERSLDASVLSDSGVRLDLP